MHASIVLLAAAATLAAPRADAPPEPGVYWEQTVEMQMSGFAVPAQTMKICLPKKQEWKEPPQQQDAQGCKMTEVKRSGKRMTWKMACEGGTTGEGEMTWTETSFAGKTLMRTQAGEMRASMKGRKVGGDCDANALERDAARMQAEMDARQPPGAAGRKDRAR